MDVTEIRRAKLILLTTEHGRPEVARRANTSPDYISQIQGEARSRKMGGRLARKLELAFNKPQGWMDNIGEGYGSIDEDTLALARAIQSLPSSQRAAIQTLVNPHDEPETG